MKPRAHATTLALMLIALPTSSALGVLQSGASIAPTSSDLSQGVESFLGDAGLVQELMAPLPQFPVQTTAAILAVPVPLLVPFELRNSVVVSLPGTTYECTKTAVAPTPNGDWGSCDKVTASGGTQNIITYFCRASSGPSCPTTNGSSHVRIHDCWFGSVFSCEAWRWVIEFDKGFAGYQEYTGTAGLNIVHVSESIGQTVAQNLGGNVQPSVV